MGRGDENKRYSYAEGLDFVYVPSRQIGGQVSSCDGHTPPKHSLFV